MTVNTQNDPLPTREQLSMLAAATKLKQPAEAIQHGLLLWHEAGKALHQETGERLASEKVSLPKKFPAKLDKFLTLVVRGGGAGQPVLKRYFAESHLDSNHAPAIEDFDGKITQKDYEELERNHLQDAYNLAEGDIARLRANGFKTKAEWLSLALQYLKWRIEDKSRQKRAAGSKGGKKSGESRSEKALQKRPRSSKQHSATSDH